jgi:hypothetical protein
MPCFSISFRVAAMVMPGLPASAVMTAADPSPVIDLRHGEAWHRQIGSEVGTVSLWVLVGKGVVAAAGVALAKPLLLPLVGGGLLGRWLLSRQRRPRDGRLAPPPARPAGEPQPLTIASSPRRDSGRHGLNGASLFRAQHAAICTVHHDGAGQITAIQCRQRGADGPTTVGERHAHPVG